MADGPKKPSQKRGSKVAGQFGTSDYRSRQFKELLDACGLEWWNVSLRRELFFRQVADERHLEKRKLN